MEKNYKVEIRVIDEDKEEEIETMTSLLYGNENGISTFEGLEENMGKIERHLEKYHNDVLAAAENLAEETARDEDWGLKTETDPLGEPEEKEFNEDNQKVVK